MVRFILWSLVLAVIVLGAVLLVRDDPGFVLLRYRAWSVETSLAFALVALLVTVVVLYYAVRLLRGLWRLPRALRRGSQNRRFGRARRQLTQGLIDLAEGRFEQAENHLLRLVDFSDSPLVHYLLAARAAQLQGKDDERDRYLKAAHEANPDAELAIGVTQAELQLAHRQYEQALATLSHLHSVAPRHDYVLKLLARAYRELEDWAELVKLLPELRRKKLLPAERLSELERAGYLGALEQASGDRQQVDRIWSSLPRSLQTDRDMLCAYLDLLNRRGWGADGADRLVINALNDDWDDALIEAYGRFQTRDPNHQLAVAEKWLDDYGHSEQLLLALGRIALRARLWGKAQGYFEASLGIKPTPAACLALAELLDGELQQPDKAAAYYQQGLRLSLDAPARSASAVARLAPARQA